MGAKTVFFRNLVADRHIYVFVDVSHFVRLIRKNIIDSCFYLKDGTIIPDSYIREMLTATKTEYDLAYRISEMHLNALVQQRKRV